MHDKVVPGTAVRGRARATDPILLVPLLLVIAGMAAWSQVGGGGGGTAVPTSGSSLAAMASPIPTEAESIPLATGYSIEISPGLKPAWTAEQAAAAAAHLITLNEQKVGAVLAQPRILSVEAVAEEDVPQELGGGTTGEWPLVWIVRAVGTFTNDYGPPGSQATGTEGWYLFDDKGLVIGSGFVAG